MYCWIPITLKNLVEITANHDSEPSTLSWFLCMFLIRGELTNSTINCLFTKLPSCLSLCLCTRSVQNYW